MHVTSVFVYVSDLMITFVGVVGMSCHTHILIVMYTYAVRVTSHVYMHTQSHKYEYFQGICYLIFPHLAMYVTCVNVS